MALKLLIPVPTDAVSLAANTKVALAAAVHGGVTVAAGEAAYPVLEIDDKTLFEPNAIVRFLVGGKSDARSEAVIALEESTLYSQLRANPLKRIDAEALATQLEAIPTSPLTAAAVIVYGSLHSFVTVLGKPALSQGLGLMLWYQKLSGDAKIKAGIKTGAPYLTIAAAEKPVSQGPPPPEHTGAKKIAPGSEMIIPTGPILPQEGKKNILITSALPYVNNVPHLGNIVGSVLSADIFSRYAKARNYNTLFICGTDEHGTATETKAIEEKITPRELCDKYFTIHRDVYEWFQIGFDHFGRTSTPENTGIAQHIFLKLNENEYLEEQEMEQLYCETHQGYLADRFVEGTCPKCAYEDARGDQCDNCGTLLNPFELIKPRCKLDNSSPVKRSTKHIFLSLDKLQPAVQEWNTKSQAAGNWSKNSRTITENWLKEGLRPRAITRDLKWGVPVPLKGYEDKVLYVWFDACIGYVGITATYTKEWEQWWRQPEQVKLYQFMGKDNVPFHTVVFPASQLGTKEKWTMLHHLSTTEYLQYEGGKFSKSRNIGVFGNNAQEIGISPSVWRYYLALARPETSDTQFSWSEFVSRNNNELLANLGNFVNRLVKFVNAKYNGVIPEYSVKALDSYDSLVADVNKLLEEYNTTMESVSSLRHGAEVAMQVSSRGNVFLQDNKLDNSLYDGFPDKSAAVVAVGLNLIYLLSALVYPFMPETTELIVEQLAAPLRAIPDTFDLPLLGGHNIGKAKYLFKRIDPAKVDEWKGKYGTGA